MNRNEAKNIQAKNIKLNFWKNILNSDTQLICIQGTCIYLHFVFRGERIKTIQNLKKDNKRRNCSKVVVKNDYETLLPADNIEKLEKFEKKLWRKNLKFAISLSLKWWEYATCSFMLKNIFCRSLRIVCVPTVWFSSLNLDQANIHYFSKWKEEEIYKIILRCNIYFYVWSICILVWILWKKKQST